MDKSIKAVITVVVLLLIFVPSLKKIWELKNTNRQYEGKIKQLITNNKDLIEEKRRLEEDPVYLEKVAREKMGVARKGEVIFRLKPADGTGRTVAGFGVDQSNY